MRDTGYEKIAIIGDGAMATVMAMLLCEKSEALGAQLDAIHQPRTASCQIRMWGYDARQLTEIADARENKKFLPGYRIPDALIFEPDDGRIMTGAELIVSAVPCQFMRSIWTRLKDYVPANVPIVSVTKGIENDTLLRPTQIIFDMLQTKLKTQNSGFKTAALSGPTIADELARKLPATACVACDKVEIAAACKNVIGIAAGIIDGIGAGDNAKAALLSRGLAEITRLGIACGARPETFAGLAGLGDLVTTCISPKGRNRSFGERIGKGQPPRKAQSATQSVVEGIATCKSVVALAARHKVEMPITCAVHEVLFENKPVRQAIAQLMSRRLKGE
jgi:glycerol-3-phosphate dehydrogenase (NAD(P)+)